MFKEWSEIKEDYHHSLILGNGSSIAVDRRLHYTSLFVASKKEGFITSEVQQVFDHFKTSDFEFVLQALANAYHINRLLKIDESKSAKAYGQVKHSLIKTVEKVHSEFDDVSGDLLQISSFLKSFDYVFSLNYDLIVYWSMLAGNKEYGRNRFKDCFKASGRFEYENDFLRQPYASNDGATLVFYPHGSLFLGCNAFGEETKLISDSSASLSEVIKQRWALGGIVPLFVSEGDIDRKVRAIRRNGYLNYVYSQQLCRPTETLVIYGWSISGQDEHILKAIKQSSPKRIAVSVWDGLEDPENEVYTIALHLKKKLGLERDSIDFFKSESPGVWKFPN